MDAQSKLAISWYVRNRDGEAALEAMLTDYLPDGALLDAEGYLSGNRRAGREEG
jgi:hypothetical protein